jgi:hypothetical protein
VREKGVTHEQRVENAKLIAPTSDERLTLVTCAGSAASQQLVVIALPIFAKIQTSEVPPVI